MTAIASPLDDDANNHQAAPSESALVAKSEPANDAAGDPRSPARSTAALPQDGAVSEAPAIAVPEPAPPADQPLLREFRTILRLCRNDLLAYRDIVLNGRDAVGIHQARVTLRRLRAALGLFRDALGDAAPTDLGAPARQLASACGPARDWDVLIGDTLPAGIAAVRKSLLPNRHNLLGRRSAALLNSARRLRRARHDAARAAFSSPEFAAFDERLLAVIDDTRPIALDPGVAELTVRAFACDLLQRRDRKVRKLGKNIEALAPEDKHALRIRLKKLRYAATFLRHSFDHADSAPYISAAAGLQEALGAINDREVAFGLLDQVALVARPAHAHDWLAGALTGWLIGETDRREQTLAMAWRQFREAERFWRSEVEGT